MSNLWSQVCNDFVWDGSLRDFYIKGTTLKEWNQFLSIIKEETQHRFLVDANPTPLPQKAESIFSMREHQKLLSIWIEEVQLNCHFFVEDEIELDLDPRQISKKSFDAALLFLEHVAAILQRSILLTPENLSEYPIAVYEIESQSWHYFSRP